MNSKNNEKAVLRFIATLYRRVYWRGLGNAIMLKITLRQGETSQHEGGECPRDEGFEFTM